MPSLEQKKSAGSWVSQRNAIQQIRTAVSQSGLQEKVLAEQVGTVTNTSSVLLKEGTSGLSLQNSPVVPTFAPAHTQISFPHADQQLLHKDSPHSAFTVTLTIILTATSPILVSLYSTCKNNKSCSSPQRGKNNRLQTASDRHRGKLLPGNSLPPYLLPL